MHCVIKGKVVKLRDDEDLSRQFPTAVDVRLMTGSRSSLWL